MKKLRVVVVSSGLAPQYGGSAISEASLCSSLGRECEVTIFCRNDRVDSQFVYSFGLLGLIRYKPSEIFDAWKGKNEWIHRLLDSADVIHLNGHWCWENYFFARLARRKGIPYVLHPRGMLLVGHRKVFLKKIFNLLIGSWIVKNASRVIALSRFETNQFRPYGLPPQNVEIIPNGIPLSSSKGSVVTTDNNLPEKYFLYFGRLESRKNLEFLIRAFAYYVREGGAANLVLMGPVQHQYDRILNNLLEQTDSESRVKIIPPIYDETKFEIIRNSLAVIYPAIEEPFGRVPFEAVAAGVLPIVPDASGSGEYLERFLPQSIYRHGDINSLAAVLKRSENGAAPGLVEARGWVAQSLNWHHISRSVTNLYRELKPAT